MPIVFEFCAALVVIILAAVLFTRPRQRHGRHGLPVDGACYRGRPVDGVEPGPLNLFSAALAILSGGFVYAMLRRSWHLMVGGAFYLVFLSVAIFAVF